MPSYEYRVVPAPRRAGRVKVRKGEDRFAATLAAAINAAAAEGWEYVRAEAVPAEERPGLLRARVEVTRSYFIFRRPLDSAAEERPEADPDLRIPVHARLPEPRLPEPRLPEPRLPELREPVGAPDREPPATRLPELRATRAPEPKVTTLRALPPDED